MTSDGGALLVREVDRLFHVTERVAGALVDYRDPGRNEHDVTSVMAQRIFALALACGIDDAEGERRVR